MSEPSDRPDDELFEMYLDGQLSSEERQRLEQSIGEEQAMDIDLQNQIDSSLKRQHDVVVPAIEEIESWLAAAQEDDAPHEILESPQPSSSSYSRRQFRVRVGIALAALAASILAVAFFFSGTKPTPFFEPRALTQLYSETVEAGFEPYYFCEDDERFASTFAHRQGQRMLLVDLPNDRRMVGLSYLGGLSRSTTAILCIAREQPVIVFVDKGDVDMTEVAEATADLHVHRESRNGLVLYEVSPFSEPLLSPFLTKVD